MAQVDFSNARIEPSTITSSSFPTAINPTAYENVMLSGVGNTALWDASMNTVSDPVTITRLVNEKKQLMYLYQGTFTASGTEFYILNANQGIITGWKISNISFSAGDTYVFQINATLVCN